MNYKIALFVADYLLLLELTSRLEAEFPSSEVMVFGDKNLEKDLNMPDDIDYIITDISRVNEADILVTLSSPAKILKNIHQLIK